MDKTITRDKNLKEQIIASYSEEAAQKKYIAKAENGLWDSEMFFIKKYWKPQGSVIDVGCGTGRTTLALHNLHYKVTGIDLVPAMIENAISIAKKNGLTISYAVADATRLNYTDQSFDYALFSNLGWSQIPSQEERLKALIEIHRVLKPDGIFILVTPQRIWLSSFFPFWIKQWLKQYTLKPLGFYFKEEVFGDRFYDRETKDTQAIFKTPQYVYIPSIKEVTKQLKKAGFNLLEANDTLQISQKDIRKVRPIFYIAKKT